jgi:hypothetical protein
VTFARSLNPSHVSLHNMQLRAVLVVSLAALAAASDFIGETNVIEATSKTFDTIVGKGKPALVELYVERVSLQLVLTDDPS